MPTYPRLPEPKIAPRATPGAQSVHYANPAAGYKVNMLDLRGLSPTVQSIYEYVQDQKDASLKESWATYSEQYRKNEDQFAKDVEDGKIAEFASERGREFFYGLHAATKLNDAEVRFETEDVPRLARARDEKGNFTKEGDFNEAYAKRIAALSEDHAFSTKQGKLVYAGAEPTMRVRLYESFRKARMVAEDEFKKVDIHDRYGSMVTQLVASPILSIATGIPVQVHQAAIMAEWGEFSKVNERGVLRSDTNRSIMGKALQEALNAAPKESVLASVQALRNLPLPDGKTVGSTSELNSILEDQLRHAARELEHARDQNAQDYALDAAKDGHSFVDAAIGDIARAKTPGERRIAQDKANALLWSDDSPVDPRFRDETQTMLNHAVGQLEVASEARKRALADEATTLIAENPVKAGDFLKLHRGELGDRYPQLHAALVDRQTGKSAANAAGLEDAAAAIKSLAIGTRLPSQQRAIAAAAADFENRARDKALALAKTDSETRESDLATWIQDERKNLEKSIGDKVKAREDFVNTKRKEINDKIDKLEFPSETDLNEIEQDLTPETVDRMRNEIRIKSAPLYGVLGHERATEATLAKEADDMLEALLPGGAIKRFNKGHVDAAVEAFKQDWPAAFKEEKAKGGTAGTVEANIANRSRALLREKAQEIASTIGKDTIATLDPNIPKNKKVLETFYGFQQLKKLESGSDGKEPNPNAFRINYDRDLAAARPTFKRHAAILDRITEHMNGLDTTDLDALPGRAHARISKEINDAAVSIVNDTTISPQNRAYMLSVLASYRGLTVAEAVQGKIAITIPEKRNVDPMLDSSGFPSLRPGTVVLRPAHTELFDADINLLDTPIVDLATNQQAVELLRAHNYPEEIASDLFEAQIKIREKRLTPLTEETRGPVGRPAPKDGTRNNDARRSNRSGSESRPGGK